MRIRWIGGYLAAAMLLSVTAVYGEEISMTEEEIIYPEENYVTEEEIICLEEDYVEEEESEEAELVIGEIDTYQDMDVLIEAEVDEQHLVAAAANIPIDKDHFPDDIFRDYIKNKFDLDEDGYLSNEEISGIDRINVTDQQIEDLAGIEYFPYLEYLYCGYNSLTSLDVSKNVSLYRLECDSNQLTSLDVSNNIALVDLQCRENQLTSLNVSNNLELLYLDCLDNRLTSLDVSKNSKLCDLFCTGNPLTGLNLNKNLYLKNLWIDKTLMTSIDITNNTALKELKCNESQLTSLDISKNTVLEELICYNNQFTVLDVSNNPALKRLRCEDNQLTSLDVSRNTVLEELECANNQLTSLDVSRNTALEELLCDDNPITVLDISNNVALRVLWVHRTKVTRLDISNCPNLERAYFEGTFEDWWGTMSYYSIDVDKPTHGALFFSNPIELMTSSGLVFNMYNLGEETYSFENYGDTDSPNGHCFGMSMTSGGYYRYLIPISRIGGNQNTPLYSFSLTEKVKNQICYYQGVQGNYSNMATVAGGSFYLNETYDIATDWDEVVSYVKNHEYDSLGMLQVGYRKDNEGGHAVNFLRYENVGGQDRIYVYDNNFPTIETYFYKDGSGKVWQVPRQTFSGAIDCIALRSIPVYFQNVLRFDPTHVVYMAENAAYVKDHKYTYMEGTFPNGEYVMYELPADEDSITIIPKTDNASFIYMEKEYKFGKITDETYGVLKLSTDKETETSNETFGTYNTQVKEPSKQTTVTKKPAERITISQKPTIKKPAATKNKITVKWTHFKHTSKKAKRIWKKIKKVQVQCAKDKAFKKIVKTSKASKNKTKVVIKGLSKKTTYYVRVRYFDGTGYSKWSGVKKIKTKK